MYTLGLCSDVEGSIHRLRVGGYLRFAVVQGYLSVLRNKDKHDSSLAITSLLLLSSVRSPLGVNLLQNKDIPLFLGGPLERNGEKTHFLP